MSIDNTAVLALVKQLPVRRQHEFACWCAERTIRWLERPHHRALARSLIEAKRAWIRGEITDSEMEFISRNETGGWSLASGAIASAIALGDRVGSYASICAQEMAEIQEDASVGEETERLAQYTRLQEMIKEEEDDGDHASV